MAVTVRGTDILFNDGTTQSTAAGGIPALDAIGSYNIFYLSHNQNYTANSNVSGSYLFRATSIVATGGGRSSTGVGQMLYLGSFPGVSGDYRNRTTAISTSNGTLSPVTGTWRLMSAGFQPWFDGYQTGYNPVIAIRVA